MKIETLPITKIRPNPLNIRREVGDVTELADSIKAHGLLEPLVVAPTGEKKQPYVLIAGHRRLTAIEQAGIKDVVAIIREDLTTEQQQIEAMLIENLQRVDITAIEEGQAYTQLLAFDGVTLASIAKDTGRSVATVKQRTVLAGLPETVREKIHDQAITLKQAVEMAEFADDPNAIARLNLEAGTYSFEHTITRLKRDRARLQQIENTKTQLAKDGVTVIDAPDGWPWRSTVKKLSEIGMRDGEGWRKIEAADHVLCAGHAAVLDDYAGHPIYVCTDPKVNHADFYAEQDQALEQVKTKLTPEQEAELLEKARVAEVLAVAAETRNSHIQAMLSGEAKTPADAVALVLAIRCLDYDHADAVIEFLDWRSPADSGTDEHEAWFIDRMLKARPDTIARVAMLLLKEEFEGNLDYAYFTWSDLQPRAYLAFLSRSGYQMTPEEIAKSTPTVDDQVAEAVA